MIASPSQSHTRSGATTSRTRKWSRKRGRKSPPQELSEQGLERVLDSAGPVPFRLKVSLYEQLAADQSWHLPIFRSLLHSGFDYYGDLDVAATRDLLPRLDIPSGTPGLDDLKRRLELTP